MMTFRHNAQEAFVWIWLPEQTGPVVAGKLQVQNNQLFFNYAKSYLGRDRAISLYEPELPLRPGRLPLPNGLDMPSCIRDAAPDAWGRRVIINRKLGLRGTQTDTSELNELTYLLESDPERIGALDFQPSPFEYCPRSSTQAGLEELLESVQRVEKGIPLIDELDQALFHGTSLGGARPKALIEGHGTKYIAKFSSSSDLYSIVKAEFIAMRLAQLLGLNVAPVKLQTVAGGRDVLLIERFDRGFSAQGWLRKGMVSALTLFGLHEMAARYASYETFAEIIRHRFENPRETLRELFCRLVFNILCGNTDDHARNHSAFWDGEKLSLTPAYDLCPQNRAGNEATQAMLISGDNNLSQLKTCLETTHNFMLSEAEARDIFERQIALIEQYWNEVCEEAEISEIDQKLLWKRQFLNPFSICRS